MKRGLIDEKLLSFCLHVVSVSGFSPACSLSIPSRHVLPAVIPFYFYFPLFYGSAEVL